MALNKAAQPSQYAAAFDPDHADLGGHALLFDNVTGSDFPLAINVFGSYSRMERALGCHANGGLAAIADKIAALTRPERPTSVRDLFEKARQFLSLLRLGPKRVRHGICQECVRLTSNGEVDLTRLPILKCWPLDGDPQGVGIDMTPDAAGTAQGEGRFITFAGIHTIHADDRNAKRPSSHNVGMYRSQLLDETHLAMHWHMHHDGASHWRSWKRLGQPMPIALCFGGESVMPYAATAPLPPGISELLMAGYLNGRGIPMVPAKTVPLRVPANSEIVIEGYVSTACGEIDWDPSSGEPLGPGAVFEGPFGDHTGYYSMPDRYPIVDVTAITHRKNAVFSATVVGPPPQEDYYIGKATERVFLPLLQVLVPDITDYHLPLFGCFHNCAVIGMKKAYPLQARRLMQSIWGAGQMAWTKMIIVVDDCVDVHSLDAVLQAIAEHADMDRDLEKVLGPLDILDHAAARLAAGGKVGIDATAKWPGEEVKGSRPKLQTGNPSDVTQLLKSSNVDWVDIQVLQWAGSAEHFATGTGRIVFASIDKTGAGQGVKAIEQAFSAMGDAPGCDLLIVLDKRVDLTNMDEALFHMAANIDPQRDFIHRARRCGIDATCKLPDDARAGQPVRPWPPLIEMDEQVIARVDSQWSACGLSDTSCK